MLFIIAEYEALEQQYLNSIFDEIEINIAEYEASEQQYLNPIFDEIEILVMILWSKNCKKQVKT